MPRRRSPRRRRRTRSGCAADRRDGCAADRRDCPPTVATAPPTVATAPPTVATAPPPTVAAAPPPPVAALRASAPAPRPRRALRIAGIAVGAVGLGLVGGGLGAALAADGVARDLNATDRAGGVFDPSQDRAYSVDRALAIGLFAGGAVLAATGAVLLIVSAR